MQGGLQRDTCVNPTIVSIASLAHTHTRVDTHRHTPSARAHALYDDKFPAAKSYQVVSDVVPMSLCLGAFQVCLQCSLCDSAIDTLKI